ncbi:hypothetical protein ACFV1L_20390 [Kitasatospora sp. NPDC059646]|uniref:hypothetical protein n=1 Tax=Kitasatospora sp. NPDC059646 TaxID=3346893 RepID=UPI0036B3C2A0
MLALWTPAAFSGVVDYDSWEPELLEDEDRLRHVRAGALVPIDVRSHGLCRSQGAACLSGTEAVSGRPLPDTVQLALADGEYAVTAHLID